MKYVKPLSLFEECMKISKEKVPGRKKWAQLLGLDLNDKYVSLSASCHQNWTSQSIKYEISYAYDYINKVMLIKLHLKLNMYNVLH